MVAIRLSAIVGEDRQVVVQLPDDTPLGTVELEVRLLETPALDQREELRAQLMAVGLLATFDDLDDDAEYISDEELEELVTLPPGALTSEQLIDEDRGPR
jgi:hypothetical protein